MTNQSSNHNKLVVPGAEHAMKLQMNSVYNLVQMQQLVKMVLLVAKSLND